MIFSPYKTVAHPHPDRTHPGLQRTMNFTRLKGSLYRGQVIHPIHHYSARIRQWLAAAFGLV
jgi:hypothetical protein